MIPPVGLTVPFELLDQMISRSDNMSYIADMLKSYLLARLTQRDGSVVE